MCALERSVIGYIREVIRLCCCTSISRRCGTVSATALAGELEISHTSAYFFASDFRVLSPVGLRIGVQYGLREAVAKYV